VPPTRFCLVHNTIGGLEDEQVVHHGLYIERVSRPLTPAEEAKATVMQHATQLKSAVELNDFISGRSPLDLEEDDEPELPIIGLGAPSWKCPEHGTTVWSCRYCLAQAIVEGPLDPVLAVSSGKGAVATAGQVLSERSAGTDMPAVLDVCGQRGDDTTEVFVRAALFTRKLARS